MWKKTTGWLFEVQKRNGILEEKDRRLYEYAYGVLLGRVAIYLITVILGIATGNWLEMLVFLLPFTVLRQYAGGIHLEKAGSCMIVSSILVLLCSQYLAWSAKLLLNEIFSLYYGKDVKFPRISFMNYMRLKTDKGDLEAEEYWKEKVKNMPSFPKLNYQKKFAEVQNVRFDRIECDFSFIETQRLYQKIKNYHFTPAAVISTIFMKTLAQYSETPGLSINVTLFNRQLLHEDVNGILGEFTNNAVISYQEKTDSLLDAIRATQEQMWRLVQYRKFEGSNILKMLSSGRAGKAIMPVVFTCMLEGNVSKVTKKRYSFKEEYAISQTPQVVLDHHVRDDLGYLKISWDYIIDIFDKQYITDIFGAYVNNIKKFMEKY